MYHNSTLLIFVLLLVLGVVVYLVAEVIVSGRLPNPVPIVFPGPVPIKMVCDKNINQRKCSDLNLNVFTTSGNEKVVCPPGFVLANTTEGPTCRRPYTTGTKIDYDVCGRAWPNNRAASNVCILSTDSTEIGVEGRCENYYQTNPAPLFYYCGNE